MIEAINWEGFEKLVFNIQKIKFPNATVKLDDKIRDIITKRLRQIDISVRIKSDHDERLIIIECKHYKTKKIVQPNVEQFVSFIKSVGADKGVMIASNGFSKSAQIYANAMGITIISIQEANELEWKEFIKRETVPIIKNRICVSDIIVLSNKKLLTITKDQIVDKSNTLTLYTMENGKYISMEDYRARHEEANFNFFYNMTNFLDFIVEETEDRVATKLDHKVEYQKIKDTITYETGVSAWTKLNVHLFFDEFNQIKQDIGAEISWNAKVFSKDNNSKPTDRFIEYNGKICPLEQFAYIYRADISLKRYYQDNEVSELDLNSGIAYVDVNNKAKEFFFISSISG